MDVIVSVAGREELDDVAIELEGLGMIISAKHRNHCTIIGELPDDRIEAARDILGVRYVTEMVQR